MCVPAGQWLVRCSVRSARHSKSCWQLSQVKMDSSSRSSSPARSSWLVTLCSPSSPPARSFPSESRSGTAASASKTEHRRISTTKFWALDNLTQTGTKQNTVFFLVDFPPGTETTGMVTTLGMNPSWEKNAWIFVLKRLADLRFYSFQ